MAIKIADVLKNINDAYPVVDTTNNGVYGLYNGALSDVSIAAKYTSNVKLSMTLDGSTPLRLTSLPYATGEGAGQVSFTSADSALVSIGGIVVMRDDQLLDNAGTTPTPAAVAAYLVNNVYPGTSSDTQRSDITRLSELVQQFNRYPSVTASSVIAENDFFLAGYDAGTNTTKKVLLSDLVSQISSSGSGVTGTGTAGQVAVFSGAAEITGSDTLDLSGTVGASAYYYDTETPPSLQDGMVAYDVDRETLVFQSPHGEISLGETHKPVINTTGSSIAAGTIVAATGVNGERFTIAPYNATAGTPGMDELYILGVVQATIAAGDEGIVISEGVVKHIDTTVYTGGVGTILYTSTTPGQLTETPPTSPNIAAPVAMIIRSASQGMLYVRLNITRHLAELQDVLISGLANGQVVAYNTANGRWENKTLTTSDILEATNLYYTDTRVATYLASEKIRAAYPVSEVFGNTQLTSGYEQLFLHCLNGGPVSLQIQANLERDAEILVMQGSTGTVTITAASGVTLVNTSGYSNMTAEQYAIIGLKQLGTSNTWVITGERKPL